MSEMQLLPNFRPIEGYRFVYHTDKARREWEPRIRQASNEWGEVERQSVVAGIRRAVRQPVRTGLQFEQLKAWAARYGLHVKPIKAVGYFENFAHRYTDGNDMFVTVVGRNARDLDTDNERELDALLDYPVCCQKFFYDHFPAIPDPVFQAAQRSESVMTDSYSDEKLNSVTLKNVSPAANALLRYASIRACPHIPCRFDCAASIALGEKMLSLYSRAAQETLLELLGGPIEYDLHHGVAIIKTRFFRIAIGSNASRKRHLIQLN